MTSREEIQTILKDIFKQTLNIEPERLKPETALRDELALDSLDMIEVVYEIEERFDVQIPEEKVREITTLDQIVDGLSEALEAKGR
jgi:acyl carrier protein